MENGLVVTIVDYGMGNLRSVANACEALSHECRISDRAGDLTLADRIILPGVGAFGEAMDRLRLGGFIDALAREVMEKQKPFLGICLGMQLMADASSEQGEHPGLGWIRGRVNRLEPTDASLRVPHVGWNSVAPRSSARLFNGLPSASFYFVHSYHLVPHDASVVAGVCDYGGEMVVALEHEHLFGTQFHPEKSHKAGLALLDNFLRYEGPSC